MARSLSVALTNHLAATRALVMGDLYEVTSPVLGVARFTSWEANVTYGGNVYSAGVVIPSRDRVRQRLGLNVDALEMTIGHGGTAVFGSTSVTWAAAAISGALDGAAVKLYRAWFDSTATLVDAVLLFGGYVGSCRPRSSEIQLVVESIVARMKAPWPRNQITSGCPWSLYGPECGLTRPTTWDAKSTLASASADVVKVATLSDQGFKLGTITVVGPTSSALYGLSRTIASVAASGSDLLVTVSPALPSVPGSGLTVRMTKGCDKTAATCETTFANLKRFGGAPMVPPKTIRGK